MNTTPKHRDTDLHGAILEDRVVPPDGHWGRVIEPGHLLRIVDLEGRQAVDFLCYDAANPAERYNAADTMKYAGTIFLTTGHGIYSDLGRPLLTIVADTCGRHDTLGGCCSAESNFFRYGVRDTPNCRDNFLAELARFGLGKRDIVTNLNFFMNVPVGVLVCILALRWVPADRKPASRSRLDIAGAITVTLALMLVVRAIVAGNQAG